MGGLDLDNLRYVIYKPILCSHFIRDELGLVCNPSNMGAAVAPSAVSWYFFPVPHFHVAAVSDFLNRLSPPMRSH